MKENSFIFQRPDIKAVFLFFKYTYVEFANPGITSCNNNFNFKFLICLYRILYEKIQNFQIPVKGNKYCINSSIRFCICTHPAYENFFDANFVIKVLVLMLFKKNITDCKCKCMMQ